MVGEYLQLEYELKAKLQAIEQIGRLLNAPHERLNITPEDWRRIEEKYWQIIEKGLDACLKEKVEIKAAEPVMPRPKPITTTPPPIRIIPIKNLGDLLSRSLKLKPPVTRTELFQALHITDGNQIKDLEAAWDKARMLNVVKLAEMAGKK